MALFSFHKCDKCGKESKPQKKLGFLLSGRVAIGFTKKGKRGIEEFKDYCKACVKKMNL